MVCKHGKEKPCPRCLSAETPWSGQARDTKKRELVVMVGGRAFLLSEGGPPNNWGFWLWPAGVALAHEVAARNWERMTVLELGAGLGLPGMVAAWLGANVTFCDKDTGDRLRKTLDANAVAGSIHAGDWKDLTVRWDSVIGSEMLLYSPAAELFPLITRLWNGRGPLLFTDHGAAQSREADMQKKWPTIQRRDTIGSMADGRIFECDLWTLEGQSL